MSVNSPHFSFFDKIGSNAVYIALSCAFRVVAGLGTGVVACSSFGVLTKLVPTRVAFVTSLAEAALNGAQAFGPFLGGLLYQAGGYKYVPSFIHIGASFIQYKVANQKLTIIRFHFRLGVVQK